MYILMKPLGLHDGGVQARKQASCCTLPLYMLHFVDGRCISTDDTLIVQVLVEALGLHEGSGQG